MILPCVCRLNRKKILKFLIWLTEKILKFVRRLNKNKVLDFLRWLIKRKIMYQTRHDINTDVKLGYTMRNQKISYFIIGITITSSTHFTCDNQRNDTHTWLWGKSIWRYVRIRMPDDRETDCYIVMRYWCGRAATEHRECKAQYVRKCRS